MSPTHCLRGLLFVAALTPLAALAQDPPKEPASPAPAACEARAGAPQWLPCGPDRVLTEAEIKSISGRSVDAVSVAVPEM